MGNNHPPPAKKPTLEETIIDMRMAAKRFEFDSRRADKEKAKEIEKARNAIRKGNDEGAKLFLNMASMKQKEAIKCLQMAHKMDALVTVIKSNTNNTQMMENINKLAPLLDAQAQSIPVEKIYTDMDKFEKSMNDILVSGKVMDQLLNANMQDSNQELAVDNMFAQMKKELICDVSNDLNTNNMQMFKELNNNPQQNINQNTGVMNNGPYGK